MEDDMQNERAVTVWSYMSNLDNVDGDYTKRKRTICFLNGSLNYSGEWMGPSDSFWIVPGTIEE